MIATICSSVKRALRIAPSESGASLSTYRWSENSGAGHGLRLASYARALIKRFDTEPLGGTTATLRDTFVQAHIRQRDKARREQLDAVLTTWLLDSSRRQLVITGEYGQGKSTAMLKFCVD
jgi:hypothetical protein